MLKSWLALSAAAGALLMASSVVDPAVARQGGGHGGGHGFSGGGAGRASGATMGPRSFSSGGVRAYSGGSVRSYGGGGPVHMYRGDGGRHAWRHGGGRRHGHFHRGRYILYGAPFAYGYYAYSDDCDWLRRRALYTGSGYWWDRYNACIYGYGY